jgi:hypothetical protein
MLPMGFSSRRWLNQSNHCSVANSAASNDRHAAAAHARSIPNTDKRLEIEREAGQLLQAA